MNRLKEGDKVLLVHKSDEEAPKCAELDSVKVQLVKCTYDKISAIEKASIDAVITSNIVSESLANILTILKPGGVYLIESCDSINGANLSLMINGFTKVAVSDKRIVSFKPEYEIGSSAKLTINKPSVWKITDDNGDDGDTIDPDNLLDEDDLVKPTAESLRVCGTTGKRKACKDCSCGLAEELADEVKSGAKIDTTDNPKSSCGSCYLGDAFRCASCPYLGMPAFKPGEKIQLGGNQLQDDI